MNVPEIQNVKSKFESLKQQSLINSWELPYEQLLTRLTAAIFFFTPNNEDSLPRIVEHLGGFEGFHCAKNPDNLLSNLKYRVTFNQPKS